MNHSPSRRQIPAVRMRGAKASLKFAGAVFALLSAHSAVAVPSGWQVSRGITPLTSAPIYLAMVQSSNTILNQIGQPDVARLAVRCQDREVGVTVTWPQVLSHDLDAPSLFGGPQTMAVLRVDGGKLVFLPLDISDNGATAGRFSTGASRKLLALLAHSQRLVVRLGGAFNGSQDAVFDTTSFDSEAAAAEATCGVNDVAGKAVARTRRSFTEKTPSSVVPTTPVLGIRFIALTPQVVAIVHASVTSGVLVAFVTPGSVAERAGIAVGDILTTIDGRAINGVGDVQGVVKAAKPGTRTVIAGYNGATPMTFIAEF